MIDEADRLLNQSFQNWLSKVLSHLRPPATGLPEGFKRIPSDRVAHAWLEAYGLVEPSFNHLRKPDVECQKLLFSATLTRDPAKVAALDLHDPEYYVVQSSTVPQTAVSIGEQFSLPAELSEKMIVLDPAHKPLTLVHLIHHSEYNVRAALVFTKSVESATRLVQLLNEYEGVRGAKIVARAYTSEMKPAERKRLLADFANGSIHLYVHLPFIPAIDPVTDAPFRLVCSDLIARGMDLPSVAHVVSYDIPLDMRKYVHRVGRTARAGRDGTAWSLVENQEVSRIYMLHQKSLRTDTPGGTLQKDAQGGWTREPSDQAQDQGEGPGAVQGRLRGCNGAAEAGLRTSRGRVSAAACMHLLFASVFINGFRLYSAPVCLTWSTFRIVGQDEMLQTSAPRHMQTTLPIATTRPARISTSHELLVSSSAIFSGGTGRASTCLCKSAIRDRRSLSAPLFLSS